MASNLRIGHGYDVHRLVEGRRCIIGGVDIPHSKGLLGHSDADVLAHALADAILGACRGGDIGKLFPDTDPAYAGADSLKLLAAVMEHARSLGYEFVDADCTIACQEPKIGPHREAMRENLARAHRLPGRKHRRQGHDHRTTRLGGRRRGHRRLVRLPPRAM